MLTLLGVAFRTDRLAAEIVVILLESSAEVLFVSTSVLDSSIDSRKI